MLQVPRYFLVLSFLCPIYTSSISQAFGQGEAEGRSIGISDSGRLGTHGTKIDNRCASSATVKLPLPTMAGKRQYGDAVYRPAAAPATLLQVQNGCPVVQPSLYGVRYMDYIPVDNLAGPTPCVTRSLNQNVGGLTYLGDASSYSPTNYRINTTLYLSSCLLAANFGNLNPGNVQVNCTLQLNAATPCRIGPLQPAIVSQSVALAGFRQTAGTKQNIDGSTEFNRFFAMVAAETPSTAPMTQAAFHKLSESIQTMSPATLSAGISVIDEQLDSAYSPATRNAKIYAGILINMVSFRPDFMDFLVPEIPRLSALVLGPVQTMSPMALNALQSIGYQKPELVVPVFIAALKAKSGQAIGPVAAATLLRIAPPTDEEVKVIADFMRRPDLPAKAQIDTIIWITSSPAIPDPIAAELIHFLDSPEESVRNRALVAISKSSPPVQDRARARLTQMINDAHETSRTKRIANEALRGEVQSDPESEK